MSGYYRAQQLPNGQVIVLCPDGLTWETHPGQLPTLESAQAHALALNEWLDQRPDTSRVSPFFEYTIDREPDAVGLLSAIDRLYAAEDQLDALSHGIGVAASIELSRGHNNNPQEARNG